ncbi:hypothetical protein D3C75_998160 [compost metagenome]
MSTFTARLLVLASLLGVFNNTGPGIDVIVMLLQRRLPQPPQFPSDIRVFHAQWTIFVPREGSSAGTTARFKLRHIRSAGRIIDLLIFPSNDSVLHKHLPAAGACTVDSVSGTHYFIVRPALAVHILPISIFLFKNGPVPGIAFNRFKKVKAVFFLHRLQTLLCRKHSGNTIMDLPDNASH